MSIGAEEAAEADGRYRAPALDKGLDILELLSAQSNGLTRAEIVRAMGRKPSEVYRMLERLVLRDYVSRSFEGDRYTLSMKLFVMGQLHPPVRRLIASAQPLLDQFASEAVQSCHLVIADRDRGIVIVHASPPGNWEFGIRVGSVLDLLTSGSGQTLLAFLDPYAQAELQQRWAGTELAATYAGLQPMLADIRERGWRIGASLQVMGIEDISVPIRAANGTNLGVLTCPYMHRADNKDPISVTDTLAMVRQVATALSLS